MASTKITYVTGTAEVRRRGTSGDSHTTMSRGEQHFVTEPSSPLQMTYVDGKCPCCPYGYHIDLDFLNFCSDLESGSTLKHLKRIQRTKRNLRKSMEIMLNEQEGIKADPNSAPPDIVMSTEAERLMHMVNYEQSATVNILRQIDSSVRSGVVSVEAGAWKNEATEEDTREPRSHNGPTYKNPPVVVLSRADSLNSLSSSSTMSSEVALLHQVELIQQQQSVQSNRSVTKVVEQPVLEMATAEMKHYSTITPLVEQPVLEMATAEVKHDFTITPPVEHLVLEMATAEMKHYSSTSSAQLADVSVRIDQTDSSSSVKSKRKQNFLAEVSATYRAPDMDSSRAPDTDASRAPNTDSYRAPGTDSSRAPDTDASREPAEVNESSVQSLREAMAAGLQRIKVLEEQVKTIPILQVRISVLKEEKRLLNLQLKASRSTSGPLTSTVGVGDDSIDLELDKNKSAHSPRMFSHSASTSINTSTPKKDLTMKSSPPTLPKPVKTTSVAVGNHSVLEPYNLQPDLPTGYTIRENETAFGIYSKTVFEKQSSAFDKRQEQLLNSSVQQRSSYNIPNNNKSTSNIIEPARDSNQSKITYNQTQKNSSDVVTRTVGVGDANVFEDSKLQVHERELRTVIIGQNNTVAKRNVGIECRVPTRDVGVLFISEEEKPATRTIGVNVNYDTSGIFTSLDFKGERELRVALQGVLHRSVRSVGTSCRMTEDTTEHATMTDLNVGVSVGCGDEEQRVDVEVRPAVVRKSVAVSCRPDVGHKYVSTDVDWAKDASTNTYQVDAFDKGLMTDKVKQAFASTNTVPILNHAASNQTDQNVFISLDQVRHSGSNTENITRYSTGVSTDVIVTHNACINTSEKVTDKIKQAFASTNTEPISNRPASNQTDQKVFVSLDQVRHSDSNTENITKYSTGVSTDSIVTHNACVNTSEKISELFSEAFNKENVDNIRSEESLHGKTETDRNTLDEVRTKSTENFRESKDIKTSDSVRTTDAAVQEQVISEHSDHESSFLGKSEYTKKSSKYDYGNTHYSSLEISSRSAPGHQSHTSSKRSVTSNQEDFNNSASILEKIVPDNADEKFSETVVEHFILTKDGKQLISEEKITTSAAGTNRSFRQYAHNSDHTTEEDTGSNGKLSSQNITTHGSQTGSWDRTNSSSYKSDKTSENILTDNSNISVVSSQYQVAESLTHDSSMSDSNKLSDDSLSTFESKRSEQNVHNQESRLKHSSKSESSSEIIYSMRRAGSVEDFMPNDIRKYMSINPAVNKDSGLDESMIHMLSSDLNNSTSFSGATVALDVNERKTAKIVNMKKISKVGGLSVLPEIKISQCSDFQEDSDDEKKEVVEETFVKSEASICGEKSETSEQHETNAPSSATAATDMSRCLQDQGQMWSNMSSCTKDERTLNSLTAGGKESYTETFGMEVSMSKDLAEGIHTSKSSKSNSVLKSIMKHSTETHCTSTKKAITFAESVTGGMGSSSEEDNNSDANSTDSYDEGSYDGQELEVTYYSKEGGSLSQGSPRIVQVFDQNIREIYELSDDVRSACLLVATYLTDSTSVQTKQLNASQETIKHEWFQLSSHKLSNAHKVEDFLSSVNEISTRLLEYIINIADANGNTAIHYCISHSNFDIASLLLDSNACDTNRRNKAGYSPIMLAGLATIQEQTQYDVIKRLLSLGAVNARATETQQTALMLAASHGRSEMVKLLIEEGADVNLQDEDGSTALMCACEHGHLGVVNILLAHPAIDVTITDSENSTALNIAMEAGHKDIGVVLYKHLNFSKVSSPGSHKKEKKFQLFHSK
ncbi:hypothetical protein BsWGS_19489 [Bradybaena similaris]